MVGVEGGRTSADDFANHGGSCDTFDNGTCLYGTSFAAPIITGYAAIVAEKFTSGFVVPMPSAVAQRLLETARTDTITDYSASVYGRGEASLLGALSPLTMN